MKNPRPFPARDLVVCHACSTAWGWKSPIQPDGGEGLAQAQGRHREVGSEGSARQTRALTYRNQIGGNRSRTSGQLIAKSISIKGSGRRSGRAAGKAVELTMGGLRRALGSGVPRKLAEGRAIVSERVAEVSRGHSRQVLPARSIATLTRKGRNGQGSHGRSSLVKA